MKLAIDIVKSILLPRLEKDAGFDSNQTNDVFWESFATALLDFEKDIKPLSEAIYNLGLNNPEKIISKLPKIYSLYVNELAENHVLGNKTKAIDLLLESNNKAFEEEVLFLSNLESAIIDIERQKIKAELPTAYSSLVEELSTEAKAGETKVISLSWPKYAIAACLVVGLGVLFFKYQNQELVPSDTVVTAPDKNQAVPKTEVLPEIPLEVLAEVSVDSKSSVVIKEEVAAYSASKLLKVTITENNQEARKTSIVKAIEKYQVQLEKEFALHKDGYASVEKELQNRIDSLKKELKTLKDRETKYTFDGKILTMYVLSVPKEENRVLLYNDVYYLKKDNTFYQLTVSKQPQLYKKETDPNILEKLDEIVYNGN